MRANIDSHFEHGLAAGACTGTMLLAETYILLAPTSDIRARLPFLLDAVGGVLTIFAFGVFSLAGLFVLALLGSLRRQAVAALVFTSLMFTFLLQSGEIARIVPPLESPGVRLLVFLAVAGVCLGTLRWERTRIVRRGRDA
jgi:hypothetical protein